MKFQAYFRVDYIESTITYDNNRKTALSKQELQVHFLFFFAPTFAKT